MEIIFTFKQVDTILFFYYKERIFEEHEKLLPRDDKYLDKGSR